MLNLTRSKALRRRASTSRTHGLAWVLAIIERLTGDDANSPIVQSKTQSTASPITFNRACQAQFTAAQADIENCDARTIKPPVWQRSRSGQYQESLS